MKCCLIAAVLTFGCYLPAGAFILGGKVTQQWGTGQFQKLEVEDRFTVGADTFESDNLYAFDEDQNIRIDRPLRVDIGGSNGRIEAGEVVASHYVFFDPVQGGQIGYVDFDAPILGVAASQATMAASDFLANTDVEYLNPALRGLEWGDLVWIDPDDPFRLWVNWTASTPGDYVRVFTARSPTV
ncbi:MAG: hypothetical protein AAF401_09485 [Pseudomonadota bacterium]